MKDMQPSMCGILILAFALVSFISSCSRYSNSVVSFEAGAWENIQANATMYAPDKALIVGMGINIEFDYWGLQDGD